MVRTVREERFTLHTGLFGKRVAIMRISRILRGTGLKGGEMEPFPQFVYTLIDGLIPPLSKLYSREPIYASVDYSPYSGIHPEKDFHTIEISLFGDLENDKGREISDKLTELSRYYSKSNSSLWETSGIN